MSAIPAINYPSPSPQLGF